MTAITKLPISSMEELRAERLRLKIEINSLEFHLKEEYSEIADKARSVGHIFSTVSKFGSLFKGGGDDDADDENGSRSSVISTALKVAVPVLAGGFLIKRKSKFLLKSLFGYTLGQAAKYVMSKNISEHVQDIKHVLHKDKPDENEEFSKGKHDIF